MEKRYTNRNAKKPHFIRPDPEEVRSVFQCSKAALRQFSDTDPLNPGVRVNGWVCMADGPMFGSLYIWSVNNVNVYPPQLIYGVPKVNFLPSQNDKEKNSEESEGLANNVTQNSPSESPLEQEVSTTNPFALIPACSKYYLANKWNGFPIQVFKYYDAYGKVYISIKNRAYPFVKDLSGREQTLTLVKKLFQLQGRITLEALPDIFLPLVDPEIQSITFEVCGYECPQLVQYAFPLEAKPLFVTRTDGTIIPSSLLGMQHIATNPPTSSPFWNENNIHQDVGPEPFDAATLLALTSEFREKAQNLNDKFRAAQNKQRMYTFNNFAIEGKVLYLLDDSLCAVSRTALYKIKPSDLERCRWPSFDDFLREKALSALESLRDKDMEITPINVRREMDIDERDWEKFEKDIMQFVQQFPDPAKANTDSPQKMVVLVGLPGSGKSTIAKQLVAHGWARVNQDEMGSRQACEIAATQALRRGESVVVDRCNFDFSQRIHFIRLAYNENVTDIRAIYVDTPAEVCKQRVSVRKGHPTIPDGDVGISIIDKFTRLMIPPRRAEGFTEVIRLSTDQEIAEVIARLAAMTVKINGSE